MIGAGAAVKRGSILVIGVPEDTVEASRNNGTIRAEAVGGSSSCSFMIAARRYEIANPRGWLT